MYRRVFLFQLRKAKARALRFKQQLPAVLIFGLRRGGTTMIADTVCANRGVWFADEPYAMFPERPGYAQKTRHLFVPQHSHYAGLRDAELDQFASFSHALLDARFRTMGTSRRTLPGLRANRVCLKILNAPWMLDWFRDHTNSFVISVLRHPGAQARSVLRQKWAFPVEAYLKRDELLAQAFSERQVALAHDIMSSGDPWRIAILDWVVTSHPLRRARGERVYRTTYEQIISEPESFIDDVLVGKMGLTNRADMLTAIHRPSGSSKMNVKSATDAIRKGDVRTLLHGWRAQVSKTEHDAGQRILDAFEVEEYQFGAT